MPRILLSLQSEKNVQIRNNRFQLYSQSALITQIEKDHFLISFHLCFLDVDLQGKILHSAEFWTAWLFLVHEYITRILCEILQFEATAHLSCLDKFQSLDCYRRRKIRKSKHSAKPAPLDIARPQWHIAFCSTVGYLNTVAPLSLNKQLGRPQKWHMVDAHILHMSLLNLKMTLLHHRHSYCVLSPSLLFTHPICTSLCAYFLLSLFLSLGKKDQQGSFDGWTWNVIGKSPQGWKSSNSIFIAFKHRKCWTGFEPKSCQTDWEMEKG